MTIKEILALTDAVKVFRSDDDVMRAGGERVVMQYTDARSDTVYQIDAESRRYRSAKGIPATGNRPRDPFGEWKEYVPAE